MTDIPQSDATFGALSKRDFLKTSATMLALSAMPFAARKALAANEWDVIIIGGGTAGLPAAIFAADRGASVLVIEGSHRLGGTLDRSVGQMSAAGTSLQKAKGIHDTPDMHFDDVMRISKGTADADMVRLAVDNAADTIEWLVSLGWEALPDHPVLGAAHEPYSVPRYQWGPEGGMSIYRAMEPVVHGLLASDKITILVETEATALLTDSSGAVTGVTTKGQDGKTVDYRGRSVILTTGGAGGDPEMFEHLNGRPLYVRMAYPYNRGGGVRLGESVGGYTQGQEHFLCNDGEVLTDAAYPSPQSASAETDPLRRKPWEVYVNVHGNRFVKEDAESVDVREHAVLMQPNNRYWAVFDEDILENAPPFLGGWSRDDMRQAFGRHHMFFRSDNLADLARWTGIDAEGLETTIAAYNAAQATGKDTTFGREHMPRPVAKPPYYAIRLQAYSMMTFGGLVVDTSLRVKRENGTVVPNLYAAGEVLGKAAFSGQSYVGGMSVTPALTFGRLLGQKILPLGA